MTDPTRREFLISTGSSIAVGAILSPMCSASPPIAPASPAVPEIPPHREITPDGVHCYLDRASYRAGDQLTCFASASEPCTLEVIRLGKDPDNPQADEVLHTFALDRPAVQALHPGSYIHVERRLPTEPFRTMTLECWVRLWNLHASQGIVTQCNDHTGLGLLVLPDGTPAFFTGECDDPVATPHIGARQLTLPGRPTFDPFVTPPASWHHLVGIVGNGWKSLWLDGREIGRWEWRKGVAAADAPLRVGALGRSGRADGLLDADVAMPAVYRRALTEIEIRARYAERGLKRPTVEPQLLACWPLNEERGQTVADVSEFQRTGRIINHATWMIGGPSFLPAIARYRRDYIPGEDATRGHGLRLASDELYDCRWQPTFTFTLPPSSPPGLYAVRSRFDKSGQPCTPHNVFVVRRPQEAPPAPIALLFATNTWKAYSGAPFGSAWPGVFATVGNKGYQPKAEDTLAPYCFYRFHRAGQPTYQLGWRLPWPAASPYALASSAEVGYGHLSRADRFAQVWLERNGYAFNALSDQDLHRDPNALSGVKVLMIVGHSEYWSREAMRRVREFLIREGNVVCLSGNTMYWRVTHSEDDSILECRKADAWGAQLADSMRGECWHEHDQQRGGTPRDCGDPAWRTLGIEFAAASGMTAETQGAFHVVDSDHPFLHHPHETGLRRGDRFGFDVAHLARQPLGHETDVRLSTLLDFTHRMPLLNGLQPDLVESTGITLLAQGRWGADGRLGSLRDYAHRLLPAAKRDVEDSICDVIHWRPSHGGEVFAAPSIAASWTLAVCTKWDALMKNVLHHFGGD